MTAMVVLVAVAVAVALVPATAAVLWWRAARQVRRELVDALAVSPEVAGVIPPGEADRRARTAAAVAERLGVDRRTVRRVGEAARLAGLADLVPGADDDPWGTARAVARVTTESDMSATTTAVLTDSLTAHRGRSTRAGAAVRVAVTYHAACASTGVAVSGALFTAVAAHGRGHERRAAEALVHLVQGDAAPA